MDELKRQSPLAQCETLRVAPREMRSLRRWRECCTGSEKDEVLVKAWRLAAVCLSVAPMACSPAQIGPPPSVANVGDLFDDATEVVSEVERNLSPSLVNLTRCIAVVPARGRGSASHGSDGGFVACRAETSWSSPVPISISGETARVRAMSGDLIMLVMADRAMERLRHARLRLGVDVSVAAGSVGAGTDAVSHADVLSYLRSGGVLAGVDLADVTIDQDQPATVGLFGKKKNVEQLLGGVSE
jgi:lipid-binding SYLF domain-containing protein